MRTLSFSRSNERKLAGIVPCAIIAIAPTPTTPSHLLRRIAVLDTDTRITQIPNARRYSTGDLSDNAAPNAEPLTMPTQHQISTIARTTEPAIYPTAPPPRTPSRAHHAGSNAKMPKIAATAPQYRHFIRRNRPLDIPSHPCYNYINPIY